MTKSLNAFRTISEVSTELNVPQHVLRFWETKFSQVKPMKRGGGRRYYRPEDIRLLECIRDLLYVDGFTIKGVQRLIRERGLKKILTRALEPSSGQGLGQRSINKNKEKTVESQIPREEISFAIEELSDIRKLLLAPFI